MRKIHWVSLLELYIWVHFPITSVKGRQLTTAECVSNARLMMSFLSSDACQQVEFLLATVVLHHTTGLTDCQVIEELFSLDP